MQYASSGRQGASFGWRPEQRAQLRSLVARHVQLLLTGLVTVGAAARTPAVQPARAPPPCPQQPQSQVTPFDLTPPCVPCATVIPDDMGPGALLL